MALKRIALRDFVIVQQLDLDLHAGFTALTGETGAGKSILIDALQLVLGSRADAGVVREGATQADITAEFDCPAHVHAWLEEAGFTHEDSLLLRRVIDTQGRSRAWVNGAPATATQLRTLGDALLDIHGQHAWQSLTRTDAVRELLDAYAGATTHAVRQHWGTWRAAVKDLEHAIAAQDTLQRERERLQWQIGELDKLSPGMDEWEELNTQHTRLSHAQALLEAAQNALMLLEDDDSGVTSPLSRAQDLLQDSEHLEPEFQPIADVLASSLAQINDAQHSLQIYLRRTELDPDKLQELDQRLSLWMQMARRYKRTPEELPAMLQSWREELKQLDAVVDIERLREAEHAASEAYYAAARDLSLQRAKAAPKLSRAITQAMQGLGMQGGKFAVQMDKLTEPNAHGVDAVQFLVAGHPGATPKPIGKVASGGELSRLSLAIAVTTSELGQADTLIFDEVDSGVGGAVAETVGKLMRALGKDRQVLAVTHLPQVAASADHHFVVAKKRDKAGTSSSVAPVLDAQREQEIARMLGGEKISATTLAHAREMLQQAAQSDS